MTKILGILMLGLFMFSTLPAFAQDSQTSDQTASQSNADQTILTEPVQKQIIQLTDDGAKDNWSVSALETFGLKFLVRGKDALTWALNIEDGGFHNPAIEKSYTQVLTIVNSLFVLGLLAIALMWMFSILIPRKYLKRVILVYSLAVIFVNFSLPVNRLFIDGTNLLQKTLLTEKDGTIKITDIVQTPTYTDALGFQSEADGSLIRDKQKDAVTLKLNGTPDDTTSIGKIRTATGDTVTDQMIALNNQPITVVKDSAFNTNQEQSVFRFLLLIATGLAYLILALVFVLRIVILWALLIISPILLLLGIFKSTRGWFVNWLSLYGRWLLIGPLTALGLALVINIWQMGGLPITLSSNYTPEVFSAEKITNVVFYLPGKETPNTLSNTQEMMEYITFLLMLYLPIFLGFILTRPKLLHESMMTVSRNLSRSTQTSQQQLISRVLAIQEKEEEEKRERPTGIMDNFRRLVNEKIGFLAEAAMPIQKLKTTPSAQRTILPSASNFLPENLSQLAVPKMLQLLGENKESKTSHHQVIEKLAHSDSLADRKEKEQVVAVLNELEARAETKDREAVSILREIETIKDADLRSTDTAPIVNVQVNGPGGEPTSSLSINVNEAKPEADRKVRDSSMDSKSEEKGKKKPAEEKGDGKNKKKENEKAPKKEKENQKEETAGNTEKQPSPNTDAHAN